MLLHMLCIMLILVNRLLAYFQLPDEGSPTLIAEEMEEGEVPLSTYIEYWRSGTGIFMLVILVFFLIIAQIASNSCELWLRHW